MNLVEIVQEQSVFIQNFLLERRTRRWSGSSRVGGLDGLLLGHLWRADEADLRYLNNGVECGNGIDHRWFGVRKGSFGMEDLEGYKFADVIKVPHAGLFVIGLSLCVALRDVTCFLLSNIYRVEFSLSHPLFRCGCNASVELNLYTMNARRGL